MVFFSALDECAYGFRPRITKKNMCFFLPSARIELLQIFEKKHLVLVDKKNIPKKKQVYFRK